MAVLQPRFREDHVGVILSFLRHHLEDSGYKGVVVGLSGGLDSSLVAKLCADAVGPKKVLCVWSGEGPAKGPEYSDARGWAKALGVAFRAFDIAPLVGSLRTALKLRTSDRVALGNVKARVRMIILYAIANTERRLVMGTGNKSELATGYFTRYGDGGVDLLPIGDLYKTQVREMAAHLGVPTKILDRVPSAGLWPGQTDEGELGIAYADLDRILLGIEIHLSPEEIAAQTGIDATTVKRIDALVARSAFKRKMPLIPKIGIRTFGLDWRE